MRVILSTPGTVIRAALKNRRERKGRIYIGQYVRHSLDDHEWRRHHKMYTQLNILFKPLVNMGLYCSEVHMEMSDQRSSSNDSA